MDEPVPALEFLHARQEAHGYIAADDIVAGASVAGLSPAELYGAITAYPRFRLEAGPVPPAVCTGPACLMKGASTVREALSGAQETHCLGLCDQPVAVLTSEGARTASGRQPSQLSTPGAPAAAAPGQESVFFRDDDPFDAVRTMLRLPPQDLIAAVDESGLEGRGGAGFPTGRKWAAVSAAPGEGKFVVCNADESEPGTFKDRCVLDHQPRRLLAGMVLAAHAVRATLGVIYIRYEYGTQFDRLRLEIERLHDEGLLGEGFDVVVRRGAGAYVCGEETALLNSLEGRRPAPRDRPPYPSTEGLLGAPTLVQNVETLAAVPAISALGPGRFRELGQPKLYCVSGDVPSPGVFELPQSVTAKELVGIAGLRPEEVNAFTLGGLSGGLLPASALDVHLDFEDPRRYGASVGSGGIIVLGQKRCVVGFAFHAMSFFAGESCSKCMPCRIGTTRLREQLEATARFEALDAAEVRNVIEILATGSACGLGPAAGLLAGHLLANFGEEVRPHEQGRCPAGECGRN